MTPRIVLPTAPVAPTTATRISSTPWSVIARDDLGLDSVVAQLERGVQAANRLGHVAAADDAGDLDRRRRDHLDVDTRVAQDAEGLGRDARMRAHARTDERDLAHVGVGLDAHVVLA